MLRREVRHIVVESTDICRNLWNLREVGQGVVVPVKARRQLHETTTRKEYRVVADAQDLLLDSQIGHVIVESADVCGNLRNLREVGQVVVVAAEARRQLHETATREEYRVIADAQNLLLDSQIGHIVVEGAHVCGNLRNLREVGQVIVVAAEALRQFHETAAREEYRVVADAQNLLLDSQIGHVVVEGAHVGGNLRDRRAIGEVVVVAAEAVASLVRIQGVGHAQQLLRR